VSETSARAVGLACTGCVSAWGLDFQAAPVLIGVSAAFLVRIPLIKPKGRLLSEASFTLLGMLGAFVTIIDQHSGPGPSFWWGIGFGAIASSLAEIGKSAMWSSVQAKLQAAAKAFASSGDSQ
jgi:hypothetical protein